MELFKNLFSDWGGILSLGVILFIILMAVFFIITFMKKSAGND